MKEDKRVKKLIQDLEPGAGLKLKGGKEKTKAIASFQTWYFEQLPDLSQEDLKLLLVGDSRKQSSSRGLIQTAGKLSEGSNAPKRSAAMSLALLAKLLDPADNPNARSVRETLSELDPDVFLEMHLQFHILTDESLYKGDKNDVYTMIAIILDEHPSILPKSLFNESELALKEYNRWIKERKGDTDEEKKDIFGGSKDNPTRWDLVDQEQLLDIIEDNEAVSDTIWNIEGNTNTSSDSGALGSFDPVAMLQRSRGMDPLGIMKIEGSLAKRSSWTMTLHGEAFHKKGGLLRTDAPKAKSKSKFGSPNPFSEHFNPIVFLQEVLLFVSSAYVLVSSQHKF